MIIIMIRWRVLDPHWVLFFRAPAVVQWGFYCSFKYVHDPWTAENLISNPRVCIII